MFRPLNPHTGQVTSGVWFSFLDILRRESVNELWGRTWNHAFPGGVLRGGDRGGRRGSKGAVVASDA